MKSNESA
jgi:hypothetical protein